ncbi:hypothetical protein [Shewanella zhangzhouensis]|uniref:hypothetical protein n=1 Tax=Shewanella zhangzhouensis TaxID=2864213 RepID=UPI001C65D65F|nr:hypothetical protein [Shewanella zhangzhouensis]QYK05739.1 hypothetical protein K0H63_02530 [Shewanella zhangzhouensis]
MSCCGACGGQAEQTKPADKPDTKLNSGETARGEPVDPGLAALSEAPKVQNAVQAYRP